MQPTELVEHLAALINPHWPYCLAARGWYPATVHRLVRTKLSRRKRNWAPGVSGTPITVANHQVIAVESAEAALAMVEARGLPDAAVLDVGLPGMNGIDLASALRAKDRDAAVPVIFLSANVLPQGVEAGRAIGAIYLTKPFIASALLQAVDDTLKGQGPEGW